MSGLRRVIVGASGSPGSLRALRFAEDLARGSHAVLMPVLAWSPPGGDLAERRAPCPPLRGVWEGAAWRRLTEAMDNAWGGLPADVAVQPLVRRGEPGLVLAGTATAVGDALVVGAGRRGPFRHLIGGRVARYCLSHAQCPVIAVPPAEIAPSRLRGLRGWVFRHRDASLDEVLEHWGRAPA